MQDLSLDELIKSNRGAAAKKAPPAANGKGKAPGGRKGRKPKASPRDGKAQLVSAVAKSSKAKRAQKLAKARGLRATGKREILLAALAEHQQGARHAFSVFD